MCSTTIQFLPFSSVCQIHSVKCCFLYFLSHSPGSETCCIQYLAAALGLDRGKNSLRMTEAEKATGDGWLVWCGPQPMCFTAASTHQRKHTCIHTQDCMAYCRVPEVCCSQCHLGDYMIPDVLPVIRARLSLAWSSPDPTSHLTQVLPEYLRSFPILSRLLQDLLGSGTYWIIVPL